MEEKIKNQKEDVYERVKKVEPERFVSPTKQGPPIESQPIEPTVSSEPPIASKKPAALFKPTPEFPPVSPGPRFSELNKKAFPSQTMIGVGIGAAILVVAGALYAGLKWYQKKRIRRVLAMYDLALSDLSSKQKDALAAALLASYAIPGSMWYLDRVIKRGELASDAISSETMWTVLTDLYYRKTPSSEDIQRLKEILAVELLSDYIPS